MANAQRRRRQVRDLEREAELAPRRRLRDALGGSDMWPLNAPGMPLPGPSFLRTAMDLGCDTRMTGKGELAEFVPGKMLRDLYARALREPDFTLTVNVGPGRRENVTFIPGHLWGQGKQAYLSSLFDRDSSGPAALVDGPQPADVFVLGKMPWREELTARRNLIGPSGQFLKELLEKAHVKGIGNWYITNLVKFMPPEGAGTRLRSEWIKDCLPLLHAELRLVRPKYILCLGADATKALLGARFTVGYMEGRVLDYRYQVHLDYGLEPEFHDAKIMTVLHPAEALREQVKSRIIERGLARFALLISGADFSKEEEGLDHRVIDTFEDAEEWCQEVNAELAHVPKRRRFIAIDAEWQGQHPINEGSYLRTVQMSWGEKKAVCFKLRHQGGKIAFRDRDGRRAIKALMALLQDFMVDKRAAGHFLVADLEWLIHEGFDPTRHCQVPLQDKGDKFAWELLRAGQGWIDTGMMCHAVEETAALGLELLTMRYTTAPRYDIPLDDWKKEYCREHNIKSTALEGYGDCPDRVLLPYANYDADVTYRLLAPLMDLLDCDYAGQCCWEPFWESMISLPVILDMHRNGIVVDRDRVDRLTEDFMTARGQMEENIERMARWPGFNVRSHQQVREYLFGDRYNGKFDKAGNRIRIRPPGAISLNVEPLLDTSKPPRPWYEVRQRGLEDVATPGTGKMILAILAQDNLNLAREIGAVRDHRFLDQALKSTLRPPCEDEETDNWIEDDNGNYEYDAGLAGAIDNDGRVRTHLYPTAETGRWKSSRPQLHNLCLSGDSEYLTQRGWVFTPELRDDDTVAQYWPSTNAIEFVKPTSVVVQMYRGNMYHIQTKKQIDLLVTPNHRCLLARRKSGRIFETIADSFAEDCRHFHAGEYAGGSLTLSPSWVTWLCAVQADGHYGASNSIQFGFKKRRKVKRLKKTLTSLGVSFNEHPVSAARNDVTHIYVSAVENAAFVAETKRLLPEKQFGSWLLDYDRDTLDKFAEEVLFWDGLWSRKTSFSSSDKVNADWIQILWTLSNVRARMRQSHQNPVARVHYHVDIPGRPVNYSATNRFTVQHVPWNDYVYCVTVPSEFIVVRRNGKVSITGNSKQRDDDYKRMLVDEKGNTLYTHKLRSVLKSSPGYALIEFDYIGAELAVMAWNSGDATMIDHVARAQLAEDDPRYYDIHSNVAVLAFNLNCPPTKKGLKDAGLERFRTLAKNVIFGIAYGRGAKAIALQAKENKKPGDADISVEDAQAVIDAIFGMYSGLEPFYAEAKRRALDEKWLCHCLGRLRRFPYTSDMKMQGEFERQAQNFLIQGPVASAVDRGLAHLRRLLGEYGVAYTHDGQAHPDDDVHMLLQIHDAGLIEAKYHLVDWLTDMKTGLIKHAMCDLVPIYPSDAAGVTLPGKGPYRLGIDIAVEKQWSERYSLEECESYGLPTKFAAKPKK